jgi:hypothetical protein
VCDESVDGGRDEKTKREKRERKERKVIVFYRERERENGKCGQ